MIIPKNYINHLLLCCCFFLLIYFASTLKLSAEEIEWIEVSRTTNELILIDPKSINYNNSGLLLVTTKYSEVNPEDQKIINTESYSMAIDCENRLFSKLPLNGDLNKVKKWEEPINDKLIKKTILNSCSY